MLRRGLVRGCVGEIGGGGERTCDAEACLYASANARPKTRAPVKTTCVIMRWAWRVVSMSGDVY
jgi:hypothetical protein